MGILCGLDWDWLPESGRPGPGAPSAGRVLWWAGDSVDVLAGSYIGVTGLEVREDDHHPLYRIPR